MFRTDPCLFVRVGNLPKLRNFWKDSEMDAGFLSMIFFRCPFLLEDIAQIVIFCNIPI